MLPLKPKTSTAYAGLHDPCHVIREIRMVYIVENNAAVLIRGEYVTSTKRIHELLRIIPYQEIRVLKHFLHLEV